jgi:hypothetical protein
LQLEVGRFFQHPDSPFPGLQPTFKNFEEFLQHPLRIMSSSNVHETAIPVPDPFSDPDIYYGEEERPKGKEHRRAFSAVSHS